MACNRYGGLKRKNVPPIVSSEECLAVNAKLLEELKSEMSASQEEGGTRTVGAGDRLASGTGHGGSSRSEYLGMMPEEFRNAEFTGRERTTQGGVYMARGSGSLSALGCISGLDCPRVAPAGGVPPHGNSWRR